MDSGLELNRGAECPAHLGNALGVDARLDTLRRSSDSQLAQRSQWVGF